MLFGVLVAGVVDVNVVGVVLTVVALLVVWTAAGACPYLLPEMYFTQRPTSEASNLVHFKLRLYLRFVSSTYCVMILLHMLIFGYVSWMLFRFTLLKRSLNTLNILVFRLFIQVICEVLMLLHASVQCKGTCLPCCIECPAT